MGKFRYRAGAPVFLIVAGLAFASLCTGCWNEEAPVPPVPPGAAAEAKQRPAQDPPPIPAPKPPMRIEPAPEGTPPVLPLLKLTPPSAAFSLAVPSVDVLLDKSIALAKRLAPPESVQPKVDEALRHAAESLEAPESTTFADLARNLGFDPEFPVAVYVNPAETIRAAGKTASPAAVPAPADAKEVEPAADVRETAAAESESAQADLAPPDKPATQEPPAVPQPDMLSNVPAPDFVAVVGMTDAAKAEAAIKKVLERNGMDISQAATSTHEDVTVNQFGDTVVYAIAGNVLVAGNQPEMLKEVLTRFRAPAEIRYGDADVPVNGSDQAVFVSYIDKLLPPLRELTAAQEKAGEYSLVTVQAQMMADYERAFSSNDPVIGTLEWTDSKIEIKSVIDWQTHPGLAALEGEATAFRLSPLVPENTLLLLSQRFNDVNREMLKKHWLPDMSPEILKQTGQAPLFNTLKQAVEIISDEIAVAVYGEQMIPQVMLVAAVQDVAKAKEVVSNLAPTNPLEKYQDAEIEQMAVQFMPAIYAAYADKLLVVSNDLVGLKNLLDLAKSNGQTDFFSKLNPPIDPKSPHYGLFILKADLVTKIVRPYLTMFAAPKNMLDTIGRVTATIAEIRATRSKNGNWGQQDFLITLKD